MPASVASTRRLGLSPRGPPHHAWPQVSHCVWKRHRLLWNAVQLTAAHSRFLCWFQCRHSHLSGEQLGQSVFGKGVCLVHFSGSKPHRTPGCVGRKRATPPLCVQAQPGWLRIKEPGPSLSAVRSYLRLPSGRPLRPTSGLERPLFLPSGG